MADLRQTHPDMFTLAEDEDKADDLTESAFDMYYGWTLHHIMNEVAQGKQSVDDLWNYFAKCDTTIRQDAIRMNFITNHDENSWHGTAYERMGEGTNLFAAFTYVVPGMPLIYTGQLSGNNHRLEFFEKDPITDWSPNEYTAFWKTLVNLKHNNPALAAGEKGIDGRIYIIGSGKTSRY